MDGIKGLFLIALKNFCKSPNCRSAKISDSKFDRSFSISIDILFSSFFIQGSCSDSLSAFVSF